MRSETPGAAVVSYGAVDEVLRLQLIRTMLGVTRHIVSEMRRP